MTPSRPPRSARRALAVALAGGALGATLVLVASGRVWGEASTAFAGGTLPVRVTGSDVSGLPSALALVGLAALVAVFAVRRTGRVLVAGLLALCGAGTAVSALQGSADTSALESKAAEATGLSRSALEQVTHSAWPWIAGLGGLLLVIAGVLALTYGRSWPAMSGRYERPETARTPRSASALSDRPEELWKALDRGEDPTGGTA